MSEWRIQHIVSVNAVNVSSARLQEVVNPGIITWRLPLSHPPPFN